MPEKTPKDRTISGIAHIGSYGISLRIVEVKQNRMKILEAPDYPLALGKDTFTKGKIDFEKVDKISEILKGFAKLLKEYNTEHITLYATSAIREASNKAYILDQIRVKTGMEIQILDDSEEKTRMYRKLSQELDTDEAFQNSNIFLTYIGTGSLGVVLTKKGDFLLTQNIHIGSLKLAEMLGILQQRTDRFDVVIEEYLNTYMHTLQNLLPEDPIQYFVASGKEIQLIMHLCGVESTSSFGVIPRDSFEHLYTSIMHSTPQQIAEMYDLSEDQAEVLLPALSIYRQLFLVSRAETMLATKISIMDVLIEDTLFPEYRDSWHSRLERNIIQSARSVGEKYHYDQKHAYMVESLAGKLFDKMINVHGLGSHERLLLQISAILHDAGKYVNVRNHAHHSYDLIRNTDLFGLSALDVEIISNVARYHSVEEPSMTHSNFRELDPFHRLVVSKLVGILRVADALDRAHEHKFNDLKVKAKKNHVDIIVETQYETIFEEWIFEAKSDFFREVFGLKPRLKKRLME